MINHETENVNNIDTQGNNYLRRALIGNKKNKIDEKNTRYTQGAHPRKPGICGAKASGALF